LVTTAERQPDLTPTSSATELFAFHNARTKEKAKPTTPQVIEAWPSLPSDLLLASIKPSAREDTEARPGNELDVADNANEDSILAVADNQGGIHMYLDGSFPLGHIGAGAPVTSLVKEPASRTFHIHRMSLSDQQPSVSLLSTTVRLPLLDTRHARDMAQLSSTARELVWYMMRTIEAMKESWKGSETQAGANELGANWVRALEGKQKDYRGCKFDFRTFFDRCAKSGNN
jgi:hypothetical protein